MHAWLRQLETCPSTNTWALDHLSELAHGDAVFTRRQTAGRGRQGNVWASPQGVLTVSFVVDAGDIRSMSLATGLAVAHAVEDACPGQSLWIKWPNDVLLGGRKLAGILCEGAGGRMVVGIGVNLRAELPPDLPATSLHRHASPPADLDLLPGLRRYLLEGSALIADRGLAPLLPQLRGRDALAGRSLSVVTPAGELSGTGAGIDEKGRLLVVVPHGGIARVDAGHIASW